MTFADLVGQEHVSKTLSNAITSGRIAHAFLFTGVRGVGKTTSARILAKSLNCVKGPTPTPCLECDPCREIAEGTDLDVQEIDGASYNGVDEVRRLQESLPYRPSRDRYKVVIVDEVHMLSNNAWNAFLKTLEEPPPHVKFIFATTEVHKVPVTILSRVQRYDFKLISNALIAKRLRYVLEQEGIEADEAAVALMAREAAGSMRDAMSLLDQAIAWGGKKLVGEEISRVLGIAGRAVLHDLAAAVVQGKPEEALRLVARLADQGFDIIQVARDTLAHLRDVVVVKVSANSEGLVELTSEELQRVRQLAAETDVQDLLRVHQGFSQGFEQIARSSQPRAALEMLLVRLALRPPLVPIDHLTGRLERLEQRLGARGARSRASQRRVVSRDETPREPSAQPSATPVQRAETRDATRAAVERVPDESKSQAQEPNPAIQAEAKEEPARPLEKREHEVASGDGSTEVEAETEAESSPTAGDEVGGPPAAKVPAPSGAEDAPPTAEAEEAQPRDVSSGPSESAHGESEVRVAEATGTEGNRGAQGTRESSGFDEGEGRGVKRPDSVQEKAESVATAASAQQEGQGLRRDRGDEADGNSVHNVAGHSLDSLSEDQRQAWRQVIEVMRKKNASLAGTLSHAVPFEVSSNVVKFGFEVGSFHERQVRMDRARVLLEEVIAEVLGGSPKLQIVRLEALGPAERPRTLYEEQEEREALELARRRRAVEQHPLVRAMVDQLGAEILRIEGPKKKGVSGA